MPKVNPNPFKVFENDILNGGEGAYCEELVAGNSDLADIDLTNPTSVLDETQIDNIEDSDEEEEEED